MFKSKRQLIKENERLRLQNQQLNDEIENILRTKRSCRACRYAFPTLIKSKIFSGIVWQCDIPAKNTCKTFEPVEKEQLMSRRLEIFDADDC